MAWDKEWTIDSVENNYRVLGMIDPEDVNQLIADAKELRDLKNKPQVRYEESDWNGIMSSHFKSDDNL